jgi:hypothetical protein
MTNTFRLIAIMLGRFEMDVEECISAYSDLMETVFKEKASRRSLGFLGAIKAQYDSATLERAIRKVIVSRGISEEELFDNEIDRGCKVLVVSRFRIRRVDESPDSYARPRPKPQEPHA